MAYFNKGQATIQALQLCEGYITYQSHLKMAIESYQTLLDKNEWIMVATSKDKLSPETSALIQWIHTQVVEDMKDTNTNSTPGSKT
jgi:hypothetical protein